MVARRRVRRAFEVLALVVVFVATVVAVPSRAQAGSGTGSLGPLVRESRLAPAALPSGSTPVGTVAPSQRVSFEVVLAPSHKAELTALLAAQRDPTSPRYHRWLTPEEFSARFGPGPDALARVDAWLGQLGVHAARVSTFALRGSAPAATVESGLGVSLHSYARDGAHFYTADRAPLVPTGAAGDVAALLGLDTQARLLSALHPARAPGLPTGAGQPLDTKQSSAAGASAAVRQPSSSGGASPHIGGALAPRADGLTPCAAATSVATQSGSITPDQTGAQYQIGTLTAAGQNGTGSTVAVYELAPHVPNDVTTYEQCFGLANTVGTVTVDTGGSSDPGGTDEADSDIEEVATQAPGAQILSYEGPNTAQGAFDTWSAIVSQNRAAVISTSWGTCEPMAATDGELTADDTLFKQAAAQGQTVVAATGDSGSEGCYLQTGDTSLEATFPASDPSVTAVGGTSFQSGTTVAWNDCEGTATSACASHGGLAGGGGISQYAVRPSWQPADWEWSGSAYGCGTNCRNLPDVSANAGTPQVFFAGGGWGAFVGTSVASPVVAGLVSDTSTGCAAARLGDIAPTLYGLVAQNDYGSALTDVTTGDNDLTRTYTGTRFPTTTGYDAATGVGVPVAAGWSCSEVGSVSPSVGVAGEHVSVTGLGLEHATITFDGVPAQIVSETATSAMVIVPTTGVNGAAVSVHASGAWGSGTASGAFFFTATAPPPSPPPPPPAPQSGYDLVGSDGGVFVFPTGQAHGYYGSLPGLGVHVHDIVGMVPSPDDGGYFLVGSDGGVFAFGDAAFEGSLPGLGVRVHDVRGIVPTADDRGYFLVGSDGGVFAFGDAPYLGSLPGEGVAVGDVVGIAAAPGDVGYWVVEADGVVHAFGGAAAYGSLSNPTSPVSDIVATADGNGYWIVTQNGGVVPFGDAVFYGSLPFISTIPAEPVIGLVPTTGGYWLIGSDGGIFAFGAPFVGSLPSLGIAVDDIVGAVPN